MTRDRIYSLFSVFLSLYFSYLFGEEIQPFGKMGEVYIIQDNTPLYEKADISSCLILRLNRLQLVYILKTTNLIRSHFQEKWIYIDSQQVTNEYYRAGTPTIKGWVERKYLIGKNDFEKIDQIDEMFISISYAEYGVDYHIYSNGIFIYKFGDEKKLYKGNVYRCKVNTNFFSLNYAEFFWYSNNVVEVPSPFVSKITVLTNKSDFPPWAQSDVPPVLEGDFAHLTGDNVNIRAKPTTNSVVLTRLKKGARVKVLEISEEVFRVGDREGLWVYVETDEKDKHGKPIRGWMVDIYLKPKE
jgi:hypothetical protein